MRRNGGLPWPWLAPRRPWWWFLVAVAGVALLVIGLRPTIPSGASRPGVALLVTEGASDHEVLRLIDSVGPSRVFRTADAAPTAVVAPFEVVRSMEQLVGAYPEIASVVIAGWGLEPDDVTVPIVPIETLQSPAPEGISLAPVPTTAFGIPVRLAGRVRGAANDSWIMLRDPRGTMDSARVGSDGRFAVDYLPPASGPTMVTLAPDGIDSETVAWQVVDPHPGRTLILESAPTFEGTALRRWLAAGGGAVVHRSRISREVYRTEFVNTEEVSLRRLTSSFLEAFDLIVLDGEALTAMSAGEHDALRRAVTEAGTGVLVIAGVSDSDTDGNGAFFLTAAVDAVPGLDERAVRPVWREGVAPPVPLPANPASVAERFGQEAVVDDGTGRTLVQVAPRGSGHVAVMVRVESTRWLRYGDSAAYARLWSAILSQVMRESGEGSWRVATAFPSVDRTVVVEGRAREAVDRLTVTDATGEVDTVYLAPDDDGILRGRYWPRIEGWHRHGDGTGAERLFFVWAPSAWRSVTAERRGDATGAAGILQGPAGSPDPVPGRRPLPLGWVYAVFLAAMTLLWLAEDRATGSRREAGSGPGQRGRAG